MQPNLCIDCGKNLTLVGRSHRCIPRKVISFPAVNNAAEISAQSAVINTDAQRQAKWRLANAELNRLRAREGMRTKRAKQKAANV